MPDSSDTKAYITALIRTLSNLSTTQHSLARDLGSEDLKLLRPMTNGSSSFTHAV